MADLTSNNEDNHPFIIKMPDRVDPVPEYGLGYEVFHCMKEYPENIAQYIEATGESQTFADLLDNSIRVAINLNTRNLSDDDIVGLCVGNHKHSCAPYIASLFIAKYVSALDPVAPPEDKAKILQKMMPKIIFVDEEYLQNIEDSLRIAALDVELVVLGNNSSKHRSFSDFLIASKEDVKNFSPVKVTSNDRTAVIFFSSGTTGVSKGICISHYALQTKAGAIGATSLVFSHLHWISSAFFLLGTLKKGAARVLMNHFDIDKIWKVIEKYHVVLVFALNFQINELSRCQIPKDINLSSLAVFVTGGLTLRPETIQKLEENLPKVRVLQSYGLTEICGPALLFTLSNVQHSKWQKEKPKSCGVPIEGIWYKIVDPETEEILGPNQPGELRLKSKLIMNGYYNMDSSSTFDSNGWLKTGDILQYDDDQCFFVEDRLKEMVKYRNYILSPSDLEDILLRHPEVDRAGVIGIPHHSAGEIPVGVVKLHSTSKVSSKELEDHFLKNNKKEFRMDVKVVKEMPQTSTGKIYKRILKKMIIDGEL